MLSLKCLVLLLIAEAKCSQIMIDETGAGIIAGIVIGIVGIITGCVVVCVFCCRRRNAVPGIVLQPNTGTQMVISSVNQQDTTVAAPQYPGQYPGQCSDPAYPQGQQPPPAQYPEQQQPPANNPEQQQPPQYHPSANDYDVPPAIPMKMR